MANVTVRMGSQGPAVRELQAALNARPSKLAALRVDGIFGQKTLARVREFQAQEGLAVDGVVGPMTWAKLASKGGGLEVPAGRGIRCSNGEPGIESLVAMVGQRFLAQLQAASPMGVRSGVATRMGFAGGNVQTRSGFMGDVVGDVAAMLPSFRLLTAAQQATARGVYGSSIDFSKVYLSDQTGLGNRPFTAAVPVPFVLGGGHYWVMNVGSFSPREELLIHELAHVWQSQHDSDKTRFMRSSLTCQAAAVAYNGAQALSDPTVAKHADFKDGQYPSSSYAYRLAKPFGQYGPEQIASQVEHKVAAIVAHVASVAANAVDGDNVSSMGVVGFEDRRLPGVVFK